MILLFTSFLKNIIYSSLLFKKIIRMCNTLQDNRQYDIMNAFEYAERREVMTHSEYRKLIRENKDKAHRKLFDEYFNYVYTVVYNKLRSIASREDIDECVSDVFSDVYSCYDMDIELEGDIKGFIGTIASRKSISYYHRLRNKNLCSIFIEDSSIIIFPSDDDVAKTAEQSELRRILLELIDSLGEPDSSIIIQKYYYNRKSNEIAKLLSLSPVLIRVRCSRAIKRLRKMLSDMDITL